MSMPPGFDDPDVLAYLNKAASETSGVGGGVASSFGDTGPFAPTNHNPRRRLSMNAADDILKAAHRQQQYGGGAGGTGSLHHQSQYGGHGGSGEYHGSGDDLGALELLSGLSLDDPNGPTARPQRRSSLPFESSFSKLTEDEDLSTSAAAAAAAVAASVSGGSSRPIFRAPTGDSGGGVGGRNHPSRSYSASAGGGGYNTNAKPFEPSSSRGGGYGASSNDYGYNNHQYSPAEMEERAMYGYQDQSPMRNGGAGPGRSSSLHRAPPTGGGYYGGSDYGDPSHYQPRRRSSFQHPHIHHDPQPRRSSLQGSFHNNNPYGGGVGGGTGNYIVGRRPSAGSISGGYMGGGGRGGSSYGNNGSTNSSGGLPENTIVYSVKFKRDTKDLIPGPRIKSTLANGTYVKVEADRGEDLGIVVGHVPSQDYFSSKEGGKSSNGNGGAAGNNNASASGNNPSSSANMVWKHITRLATRDEVAYLATKKQEEEEMLDICREKVMQRGLPMNIVDAEYQFDKNKLSFYFEAERRVDFRDLVRELFMMCGTRIWMCQVNTYATTRTNPNLLLNPPEEPEEEECDTPIIAPPGEW